MNKDAPIIEAINQYLDSVGMSRSPRTQRAYRNGINSFIQVLEKNGVDVNNTPCNQIKEDYIIWLITSLKDTASATENLYIVSVSRLYAFLAAEQLAEINLPRLRMLIQQRSRRTGRRLPQFEYKAIEEVLAYVQTPLVMSYHNEEEMLINLRDRALIITLADTGLRIHEACNLRRGDMDWNELRAKVIGKGNKEDIVRFSKRSIKAIKDYLAARASLDGKSGKKLSALPIFARHDRGAGSKIKPITPTTGRNIVAQRVREALGENNISDYTEDENKKIKHERGIITPHSFRHYFVTMVLRGSGGNLKIAQSLARHENIAVTQRYAHISDDELDKQYHEIFEDA